MTYTAAADAKPAASDRHNHSGPEACGHRACRADVDAAAAESIGAQITSEVYLDDRWTENTSGRAGQPFRFTAKITGCKRKDLTVHWELESEREPPRATAR